MYICLNHSWWYKHNQIEKPDEKPRQQMQFFRSFRQWLYYWKHLSVFSKRWKSLTVSFFTSIINLNFIAIALETKVSSTLNRLEFVVLGRNIVENFLMFVYLFSSNKTSMNGCRELFITRECLVVKKFVGPNIWCSVDWFTICSLISVTWS